MGINVGVVNVAMCERVSRKDQPWAGTRKAMH